MNKYKVGDYIWDISRIGKQDNNLRRVTRIEMLSKEQAYNDGMILASDRRVYVICLINNEVGDFMLNSVTCSNTIVVTKKSIKAIKVLFNDISVPEFDK